MALVAIGLLDKPKNDTIFYLMIVFVSNETYNLLSYIYFTAIFTYYYLE
jgi:hypothetical protein